MVAASLLASTLAVAATPLPTEVAAAPVISEAEVIDEFVAGGTWRFSVAADFLPDGRMLIAQARGGISLITPSSGATTWSFTVPNVYYQGESGLLDVLVDPGYATNMRFYVYLTDATTRKIRVDRYVAQTTGAATLATRTLIWQQPGAAGADYHVGGSINIGADGKLYITTGDNLVSSNSQNLTNIFGKVLRVNLDGSIPADNPFVDGAGPNSDEIWAYGIRNGFRSSFDRTTGRFLVGDVGGNVDTTAYEEVDVVERGKNYGWPLCEGPIGQPKNGPTCPSGVTGPVYAYTHAIGAGCCQNKAIVGGEVYRGGTFPSSFAGAYVYADYPTGIFYWVDLPSGAAPSSGLLKTSSLAGATPVWLGVNPADGYIYWLHYGFAGDGQLRRLRYTGGTGARPPTITQATASPTSGNAPLNVSFVGAATDPNGDTISYFWEFGDGSTSTSRTPTHSYATAGVYAARLTVTANGDIVAATPITIRVGGPPTASITSPANNTVFTAGSSIVLNGRGTDPTDGTLPGSSLTWTVNFRHNDHRHPVAVVTGASYTLAIPRDGHGYEGNTSYEVTLTATDSSGLTSSTMITLLPRKVTVPVRTNVAGVGPTVDGILQGPNHDIDTIVGFDHEISVPATVCVGTTNWRFSVWSSGAPREHVFRVATAPSPLTATYVVDGSCGTPATTSTTTTTPPATSTTTGEAASGGPVPSSFVSVAPARLMDTRAGGTTIDGQASGGGEITATSPRVLQVAGRAGIPTNATAVALNVTATEPTRNGHLTIHPSNTAAPNASNLNFTTGQTVPNMVIVPLAPDGTITLTLNAGTTHAIVDLAGWTT